MMHNADRRLLPQTNKLILCTFKNHYVKNVHTDFNVFTKNVCDTWNDHMKLRPHVGMIVELLRRKEMMKGRDTGIKRKVMKKQH